MLHDYDVKLPNFTFYGGRKQENQEIRKSKPRYCCLWIQLKESSRTFDKQTKWAGVIATKTERTKIHILSDVSLPSRPWILKSLIWHEAVASLPKIYFFQKIQNNFNSELPNDTNLHPVNYKRYFSMMIIIHTDVDLVLLLLSSEVLDHSR